LLDISGISYDRWEKPGSTREDTMRLLNTKSLAKTVDSIHEALFWGNRIPREEKSAVADWVAERQGLKLSYAKMFAPTEYDMKHGMRVFTGERITSGAALRHVLGEETCRMMLQLKSRKVDVRGALDRAEKGMLKRVDSSRDWFYRTGMY
jgi:hypothetical protein